MPVAVLICALVLLAWTLGLAPLWLLWVGVFCGLVYMFASGK